jgi:putative ABC transport system permease protein
MWSSSRRPPTSAPRSLRIFDRSFAVTYWLQAVAIAIGLFGVAASFSAQVLARRKEFGLLAHLGFTRRQVLAVVAGEGAAWTAMGCVAGLAAGAGGVGGAGARGQPAEFPLDHGPAAALAAPAGPVCRVVVAGTLTAWWPAAPRRGAMPCWP